MSTLTVPGRVADRLHRARDVPFSLFAPPAGIADGTVVRLQSTDLTMLAIAVVDRGADGFRVLAYGHEGFVALDRSWATARIDAALALRVDHGLAGPGRAFRLVNGAGDGVPGLIVDVYGPFAVVAALSASMTDTARIVAELLVERRIVRGAVVKDRGRGRAASGVSVVAVAGETPPERLVVLEGPWQFEVHLTTGVNVGLFTDMRAERQRIAGLSAGRRVLNLFAYTGALSVAAASGGAARVTSVDLSEGVLAWARDHFSLNGLEAGRHHTVAADAATFVREAVAAGERYDVVLIDPPSFSAAREAPFAIDRDYVPIVRAACELLSRGGDLWLASNTRGFSLIGAVQAAVPAARQPRVAGLGGLPADYPTEPADVEARYLQTCLLRLV